MESISNRNYAHVSDAEWTFFLYIFMCGIYLFIFKLFTTKFSAIIVDYDTTYFLSLKKVAKKSMLAKKKRTYNCEKLPERKNRAVKT